jgi:hypothetical protein
MGIIGADGAAERDVTAVIAWLDTQKAVDTWKKIGTQGYCMGGPLVFRSTAVASSPTPRTALTCSSRRCAPAFTWVWRRTTTSASPRRRTTRDRGMT